MFDLYPGLAGLAHLAAFTSLAALDLWNCLHVTESGLSVLCALPLLADLSLRGCQQLGDAAAGPLAHLRKLTRLNLRACERFTGAHTLFPELQQPGAATAI